MPMFLTATKMSGAVISFPMFGDLSLNPPSSFTVFGYEVYWYGVILALGLVLGALYCARRAHEFGLSSDDLYTMVIWFIPVCVISSRLYYVLFKLDYFIANPGEIFDIRSGGLAIYGAIIGGIIVGFIFCRVKKIPFFAAADLVAFGLLIGQAVGRWGNFINREAFGAETDIFCRMGLSYPGGESIFVHPTFLYESLWNFVGLILLHIWSKKHRRKFDGEIFWLYVLWYGLGRAWIEGLRTDSLYIASSDIRVSQLLAIVSALTAAVILIVKLRKGHPQEALFVDTRAAQAEADGKEQENG